MRSPATYRRGFRLRRWALLALFLVAFSAQAVRLPAPGGNATVSVDLELLEATTNAHLYSPIVEPALRDTPRERQAFPTLPGHRAWMSNALERITPSQDAKIWKLSPRKGNLAPSELGQAVAACFDPATDYIWPAKVILGAGIDVEIVVRPREVILHFDKGIGPLPALLAGCPATTSEKSGAFSVDGPGRLFRRDDGWRGPPLISHLTFRSEGETADVMTHQTEDDATTDTQQIFAPFPDVILMIQPAGGKGIADAFLPAGENSALAFHRELNADTLAGIYWDAQGGMQMGILPPGVAPPRPFEAQRGPVRAMTLALRELPPGAPNLMVRFRSVDGLVTGIVERLALMLRSRGIQLQGESMNTSRLDDGIEVRRWRPGTADPGLAMLSLAGEYPTLPASPGLVSRLLSKDAADRLSAAMDLERQWLESRRILPLMWADRRVLVPRGLVGVSVRADGVPLLHEARWEQVQ